MIAFRRTSPEILAATGASQWSNDVCGRIDERSGPVSAFSRVTMQAPPIVASDRHFVMRMN